MLSAGVGVTGWMRMRLCLAAVTAVFVVVGLAALVGALSGFFVVSADGGTPDGLAQFNSAVIVSFSLMLISAAVWFAKANWPNSR